MDFYKKIGYRHFPLTLKETLNKLISFMLFDFAQESVRQANNQLNQLFTVRPELVEGLNQNFLNFMPLDR